jgi:hypothetical protein
MANLNVTWWRAQYHPQDATSIVGGTTGNAQLTGVLDEIFEEGASRFLGRTPYQRFRKIFVRNDGDEITDCVAFWADMQHREQLAFAFEQTTGDTSVNSATMPSGYETGDFYSVIGLEDAVDVPGGTLGATGDYLGFWLMLTIPNGLTSETGCFNRLAIAGVQ